jgi:hypothetical protein
MAEIGRNKPCPCGSGRKYKRCCLLKADSSPASARQRLHDMDGRLLRDVSRWAAGRFGLEFDAAYDEYPQDIEREEVHIQLFVPWSCCHFRIQGRPAIAWYLEERGRNLSPSDRAWLEAQQRAWLTVWEVTAVRPGESMEVVDLLSKEERVVHEVSGSKTLGVRDALLARVVDHDSISVFAGCHPRPLPPREADQVVSFVRLLARGRGKRLKVEKLREPATERTLLDAWNATVDAMDKRPPPKLQNTDSEPLLLTTDHFEPTSRSAVAEVKRRLAAESDVIAPDPDEPGPEREYAFQRAGNKMHKNWDNTIIGRVVIEESAIRLETNSRERADVLRARFESLCAGLVKHRAREHMDPMSKARPARPADRAPPIDPEKTPELATALRSLKDEQYMAWLNQEIPALDGRSPRQAVKMPALKKEVELILKEIEHRESREPEVSRFDVGRLRAELRLPP